MKILVFGKTGQVATELQRQAKVVALGRDLVDLTDPSICAAVLDATDADVIINAAAYTAVDHAESQEAVATLINSTTPRIMAETAAIHKIPFLHISTDYVFDGSGDGQWREEDPVNPINAYGRTKLRGEEGVRAAGGVHAILRTSWVFSAHRNNFVKTMLRLSETESVLNVVEDQIGKPTPAADIAATLLKMAEALCDGHPGGTYHYAGKPWTSWKAFACETFAQAGRQVEVKGIPSSSYLSAARRPLNSRLDCSRIAADFGIRAPDWRAGLRDVLTELGYAK